MRYRRDCTEGGTYFFTLVTARRHPTFAQPDAVQALRISLRRVAQAHPFTTLAYVLLPDHFHVLWRLPPGDANYALRWRLVKHGVSRALGVPAWQPRFWEHRIRDEADFERHADYIHFNPVKHGYVSDASLWPHSSLHVHIDRGNYAKGWGTQALEIDGRFGE